MVNLNFENEAHYISLLKNGNKAAFEVLYDHYSNLLYSKILFMTKIPDVADDLVQEIFLKTWEKRASINEELSFKAWLYKISENAVYDYYRKLAVDSRMQKHFLQTYVELYNQTEDYILNKERASLLEKALSQLPEQRKLIFKLCKIEGKSYQEVAALLNISASTVSNQLVKGTKNIKNYVFFHSKEFLLFMVAIYLRR